MKGYHLMGKAPFFTNCFMLTDNSGNAVLIDCSADIEKVKTILSNDRVTLSAILLTHGHNDHRETLDEFKSEFGCDIYLGEEDAELFGIQGTKSYNDGETLTFGEISLKVFKTPGHTPGSVSLLCDDMLFCGDTLFAGTVGRTDLKGGDFEVLKESLAKLHNAIPDNTQIFPGHNHFSTMGQEKVQNPYLKNIR